MNLKSAPVPFIVIRLWPHHHATDAAVDALLAEIGRWPGCCDELWFATELGFPKMEVHLRSAERMGRAAGKARAAGIRPGIQLAASIGHADTPILPADGIRWRGLVGADGRSASMCHCPRSEEFRDYLRQAVAAYAAFGPSSFWIDDDLRMHHHGAIGQGCFCEACLAAFSTGGERRWDRESLVAALHEPDAGPLRIAWTRFNGESLADLARVVAEAVDAVAPECRLAFQHCGQEFSLYNGPDWAPVFRALAEATGIAPGSRPGHGCYADHQPREMIDKAFLIARQVARLPGPPEGVEVVCPEVENFTHNAMGKTAHGTAVESTLDLAVGCNSLSYAILCSGHESLDWYGRTMLSKLAAWRPFWQRFVERNRGTRLGGVDVLLGREQVGRPPRPGESPFAWAQVNLGRIHQLTTLGLPLCTDSPAACAAILHADAVDGLTDAELRQALAGGLLIDGVACHRLVERGFGSPLGVSAEKVTQLDWRERLTADPANGSFAGQEWWQFFASDQSPIYRLRPLAHSAPAGASFLAPWAKLGNWDATPSASPGRGVLGQGAPTGLVASGANVLPMLPHGAKQDAATAANAAPAQVDDRLQTGLPGSSGPSPACRVRILGECVDVRGQIDGAATVLVENELGGRVAILAFDGWQHNVSSAKRWQMLAAADWVSRDCLPVFIETAAQVVALPRVDSSGRLVTATLLNASIDFSPELTIRLRSPAGRDARWISPDQPPVSLPVTGDGSDLIVRLPPIRPWSIGYIDLT